MKKIVITQILALLIIGAYAQGIYNDGAYIVSTSGSYWVIDNGSFTLTSAVYPAQFDKLTITDDASLTLATPLNGSFMTVNNEFTIASGGSFTAESGSSLITNGAITASSSSMTFERSISGSNDWHMLSAPLSTAISSETTEQDFSPGDDDDFYAWYEPSPGVWVNYKTEDTGQDPKFADSDVNNGDLFLPGKGYLVANLSPSDKEFVGVPNSGNITFNLAYSGSKGPEWNYVSGWNLMGNPYPSSLNWQTSDHSLFYDIIAYVYDQDENSRAGGYIYINGDGYPYELAPNQGFFVLAKSASEFTFEQDKRVHDAANPFRGSVNEEYLSLRVQGAQYDNKTIISHNPESSFERDPNDAIKMFSFNELVPSMYSFSSDGVRLAINSMPEIIGKPVNLGFKFPSHGTYTLSLTKVPTQLSATPIYLEDKLTDTWTRIDLNPVTFTSSGGEINERFILHMGVVGIEESIDPIQTPAFYANSDGITIINNLQHTGMVRVINILGQEMTSFKLDGSSAQKHSFNMPSGVYVVNVKTTNGQVYTEKVVLN